jgi:biotin operon repressor
MKHLTVSELRILQALTANGGGYVSLFRLAVELDRTYKTIWINTLRLSWGGYVIAERDTQMRGRPYKVRLASGLLWPMALLGSTREPRELEGLTCYQPSQTINHKPEEGAHG